MRIYKEPNKLGLSYKSIDEVTFQIRNALISHLTSFNNNPKKYQPHLIKKITRTLLEYKLSRNHSGHELTKLMILNQVIEFIENYTLYWKKITTNQFSESWDILQNSIDTLSIIEKNSSENITKIASQLIELEKAYPFEFFISPGVTSESVLCSICGSDINSPNCNHITGKIYDGVYAVGVCQDIKYDHLAIVSNPENKRLTLYRPINTDNFYYKVRQLSEFINLNKLTPLSFEKMEAYDVTPLSIPPTKKKRIHLEIYSKPFDIHNLYRVAGSF